MPWRANAQICNAYSKAGAKLQKFSHMCKYFCDLLLLRYDFG